MGLLSFLAKPLGEATGQAAGGIIDALGNALDKVFTSDEERVQAEVVLEKLRQYPDELQVELNKIEAAHSSIFVAGWRPAIGWVCATSLAVYYIPRFVLGTALWCIQSYTTGALLPMPEMGIADIIGLVLTLLGMSWIRKDEKIAGVAR